VDSPGLYPRLWRASLQWSRHQRRSSHWPESVLVQLCHKEWLWTKLLLLSCFVTVLCSYIQRINL
jgi:hypothetical protein